MKVTHATAIDFENRDDGGVDFVAVCSCGWSEMPSPAKWRAEAECAEHETWAGLVGSRVLTGYARWPVRGAHGQADYERAAVVLDGMVYAFDGGGDGVRQRASIVEIGDVPREAAKRIDPPLVVEVRELSRADGPLWFAAEILYMVDERTDLVVLEVGDCAARVSDIDGPLVFHVDLNGYRPNWLSYDVDSLLRVAGGGA